MIGIFLATLIQMMSMASAQEPRFNETPDPYFHQTKTPQTVSEIQSPGFDPSMIAPKSLTPVAAPKIHPLSPEFPQTEIWLAPLTPIRISKPSTSNSMAEYSATPVHPKSIIRENYPIGNQNEFSLKSIDSSNAFSQSGISGQPFQGKSSVAQEFPAPDSPMSPQSGAFPLVSGSGNPESTGTAFATDSRNPSQPLTEFGGTAPNDPTSKSSGIGTGKSAKTIGTMGDSQVKPKSEDPPKQFEPTKVIALVGGEPVFVGDLIFEINQMIEQFMPQAPEEIKEQERQKMIPKLLPKFVEQKILYLGSVRLLPDGADIEAVLEQAGKEFDDKALNQIMEKSGIKSVAEFDAHLRIQGSSLRKLRRTWSIEQLTRYFLSQQLKVATDVTHQEMLDSYRKSYDTYAIPARSRWEQVMIRFDRSASRNEAKTTLDELRHKIVYGANLAEVAKNSSHGFRADEGGQHDWTTRGALVLKELDEAIFSLPVGELSEIIETRDGYHLIRVLERTEATHKPFLEAQVEIKERILNEKRTAAYEKHLAKLKDEIPVEYLLNDDASANASGLNSPRTAQR